MAGAKEKETLRFKSRRFVIIIPRVGPLTELGLDELQEARRGERRSEDWRQVWHPGDGTRIKWLWCGKRGIYFVKKFFTFYSVLL